MTDTLPPEPPELSVVLLRQLGGHRMGIVYRHYGPQSLAEGWRMPGCVDHEPLTWAELNDLGEVTPLVELPTTGVTREQWATRNLRSGGSIVRWSEADARDDLARSRQRDPYGPDPDPRDLAHRWWTEYADGSVAGTPWTVVDDEPSDRVQTAAALVALGQDSTTGTIETTEGQERSEEADHGA